MKKYHFFHIFLFAGLIFSCLGFWVADSARAKGVKTSYKRYSIFKYKNEDVLCEPYTVTKDDWLYKIFRKKGEISEKDFPYFLLIFKELNPQISNIDAIAPGIPILIPLKKVKKKDYDLSTPDNVDVPVIEFSSLPEDKILAPFVKKHTIKKGENISSLVDKEFLKKSGRLSEEGIKAFQLANPNIQNINIIHEGDDIYLPDPAIKSEPWFQSFFSRKPKETGNETDQTASDSGSPVSDPVDELKLLQLKRYTSLIGGTLLSQGKMYFPDSTGSTQVLDLSKVPVIETEDGKKILVMSGVNQNSMLLDQVKKYWKNLRIEMISQALEELRTTASLKPARKPNQTLAHKERIKTLLSQTDYDYIPETKIPFVLNKIQLEASFGRIIRKEQTDLLINFGNVYGKALNVLEKKEFKIISIAPKLTPLEVSKILFSNLGYATWGNPSFFTGNRVESIEGVYAVKEKDKIFIPEKPLSPTALAYLNKEDVKIISPVRSETLSP